MTISETTGFKPRHWQEKKYQGFAHLKAEHIERYNDALPEVKLRLAEIQEALRREFGPTVNIELITDPSQEKNKFRVFSKGKIKEVIAGEYLQRQVAGFEHPTMLLSAKGIDYLMEGEGSVFQVTDALEVLAHMGDLKDGSYVLIGPSGLQGVPAELYDAIRVNLRKGKAEVKAMLTKSIAITDTNEVLITDEDKLGRIILGQHTLIDLDHKERKENKPIVFKITGGTGEVSIEAAVKKAMEANGVKNGAFFVIANGGDTMKVVSAVIKEMPTQPLTDLAALESYQLPRISYGGIIQTHGHWTPHHVDELLNKRTGRTYQLHRHGYGVDKDGNLAGAHINGIFPDKDTVTYVVIKPIDTVYEIDPKPPLKVPQEKAA